MGDEWQRENLMRFFKTGKGQYGEGDRFIGIKVPDTRMVVKEARLRVPLDEIAVLLDSEWHEARLCGFLCAQPALPEGDRTTLAAIARAQQSFDGAFADLVARDETGALTAVIGRAYTDGGHLCYTLDIRAPLCSEPAAVRAALERYFLSHDATLTSYEASPGFYLGNNRFAARLGDIYAALGHKGRLFTMGGGTYARHLPNAFSIGTMTEPRHSSLSLPDGRGGEHQSDECLCVDDLLSAAHVLVRYLLEADRYLQQANT
ncbi:MAG: DNA alkylation repair protein, partial [Phascolarctobacterium sp.]|nr:DNA alkylation repair protein [Phascolarctobacterium sp.]